MQKQNETDGQREIEREMESGQEKENEIKGNMYRDLC